jgi:hypothetical protein
MLTPTRVRSRQDKDLKETLKKALNNLNDGARVTNLRRAS